MSGDATADALGRLRELLGSEGGPLAGALAADHGQPVGGEVFAPLVVAGDRAKRAPERYALLVESILEGYLVHYGRSRILEAADPDLRVLAGDYLYAFGLEVLAQLGDVEAVGELADLISLCASVHSAPDPQETGALAVWNLTGALWGLAVLAVACGDWPEQREVKRAARAGGGGTSAAVLEVAERRARSVGLANELQGALIAFRGTVAGELPTT